MDGSVSLASKVATTPTPWQMVLREDLPALALSDWPRPAGDNGWGMHFLSSQYYAPEEVDRQILGLASRQVAGFLFQPLIRKVLGGEAGSYREALQLSVELYGELADSAGYQAGLIRRTLERSGFL